jgi:hypothetical protein
MSTAITTSAPVERTTSIGRLSVMPPSTSERSSIGDVVRGRLGGHASGSGLLPLSPRGLRAGSATFRMTVVARDRSGAAVFSPAKLVAPFAGPVVTRATLFPEGYGLGDGVLSGACGLLINAGWNLAREFVLPGRRR